MIEQESANHQKHKKTQPAAQDTGRPHTMTKTRSESTGHQQGQESRPGPYEPKQLDPQDVRDAISLIDDYLLHDESFRNYLIDTTQHFLEAGAPVDERIGHLAHRAANQLKRKYPREASLTSGTQMEAASQAICIRIIQDASHLKTMVDHYRIMPPLEVAQSIAPMAIMQQSERLGRSMLKDPAIRNICTHMAYRMARLNVDASGMVEFDGIKEITNYANMTRTYLAKHPDGPQNLTDAAIRETGRWLAQQVNERANAMVPHELATLWKEIGDIPNPLAGEYASHRFEERDWLADNLHTYNKRAARTPQREPEAITQQIPAIGDGHDNGTQIPNHEKGAPPGTAGSHQRATPQEPHDQQPGKHGVGERLRSLIGSRANGRIAASTTAASKSVDGRQRQTTGRQGQQHAPMR